MENFGKKASLYFVLFVTGLATISTILMYYNASAGIFYNLAAALIITWVIIVVIYLIWSIYLYNINYGWDEAAWKEVEKGINKVPEPKKNPHEKETLGLPGGTVRGILALSLLIGGLAMAIASLSMPTKLKGNELFIDNFEFFKTAFLMMIAFYFGNKSLDFLKDRKVVHGGSREPRPAPNPPSNNAVGNEKIDDDPEIK